MEYGIASVTMMETDDDLDGYAMTNVRPQRTGMPFTVWVSPKGNARHDVRVKVGYHPKLFPAHMGTYSLRPFAYVVGERLSSDDEKVLKQWIDKNIDVVLAHWYGDIEYSEELLEKLVSI